MKSTWLFPNFAEGSINPDSIKDLNVRRPCHAAIFLGARLIERVLISGQRAALLAQFPSSASINNPHTPDGLGDEWRLSLQIIQPSPPPIRRRIETPTNAVVVGARGGATGVSHTVAEGDPVPPAGCC